jgi:hypothetical protein
MRALAYLTIDHAGEIGGGGRLGQQRDPKSRTNEAHQTPATDVVPYDLGAVARRRRLRNQEIMQLRSRITPAQQDRLILKVDPIDSLSVGKRIAFGNGDQYPLAPQRQDRALR